MKSSSSRRREFLKQVGAGALACCSPRALLAAAGDSFPNPVGYATLTWPENEFSQALETISALGFKGVQMLGWVRDSYPGGNAERLKERLQQLKLQPVALSCSKLRLAPESKEDQTVEFRSYAEFFQRMGGRYLQVMDNGQPGKEYSSEEMESLASQMNKLGRVAQDYKLTLGYHPHMGTLGETREGLGRILDSTDKRLVKLIADVAHLALGGSDPAEVIRAYHDRLLYCHFKDVRKDVALLARKDRSRARKQPVYFCEIGSGSVDFHPILRAFRELKFDGWVIVELDEAGAGGPSASARANKAALEKLGLKV